MAPVAFLARARIRRRLESLLALALVIAAGIGVALAAADAAARTERAYPDYLRHAGVGDVVVNPSLNTARAKEIIAGTPGVLGFTSDDVLGASLDDGAPRTQSVVDSNMVQLRLSTDGRYVRQDRPIVDEGRMLRSGHEVFVSREAADAFRLDVGDEVPIAFWAPSFNTPGLGAAQEDLVEAVGTSRARVVGIGTFPDEVLVDELFPRLRMIATPEVAEGVTCLIGAVERDDPRSLQEIFTDIVPADCASTYRYFSLDVEGGEDGVAGVVDSLETSFAAENRRLPHILREQDVGYVVIPTATRDIRERVERSLRPAVTALRLVAVAAGLSTVVVAALAALRAARRDQDDVRSWRSVGATRGQRALALGLPLALAAAFGLVLAVAVGWLASGLGPVAAARTVEPHSGFGVEADVAALTVGAAAALLLLVFAVVALTASRVRAVERPRRPSLLGRVTRWGSPSRALGVRAAFQGSAAGAVLAGATVAVGVVLASLVFSTSLGGLLAQPARYGWSYDAAVIVGFGYGGADVPAIEQSLDRPEVAVWGIVSLGSVTVEGQTIASVADYDRFDRLPLAVVEGRLPVGADEVAVGAQTADQLEVDVGDRLAVDSYYGSRAATVTGTVVLPPVGQYESDRAATGTGMLLSRAYFAALVGGAEEEAGLPPGTFTETSGSFVGIDLRDGVDPAGFIEELDDDLLSWDRNRFESPTYAQPVRPADIANVAEMRRVPILLGGLFALAMAGALALGIAVATRDRRRELAILRAIGCSAGQVASSVRWHALAVVAVALVVGVPLGMAGGRVAYRAFAEDLGVVPDIVVTAASVLGVVLAAIVVGLLASAGPGWRARREPPAEVLHTA